MRTGGEELADARHLESLRRQTEGGAQTGTAGAYHDGVVLMLDHGVRARAAGLEGNMQRRMREQVQKYDELAGGGQVGRWERSGR